MQHITGPIILESLEFRMMLSATVFISEVHPIGSSSGYAADWFELTNTGNTSLDITGWKMDDGSNLFANSVALRGLTNIPAGKSAVFFEGNATGTTDATIIANFSTAWFGSATPPAGVLVGAYGGTSVGLSSSGDAVNLYDSAGLLQANVTFGVATTGTTFDNTAGLNNAAISTLSSAGVNGAFLASNGETGSPGRRGITVDLSTYVRIGRYDLPEPTRTIPPADNLLAQEASGVTYNWDTDSLFIVGDGGKSVTQVSKTGALIDTMTLALGSSPQGTDFYDPEGVTYVGGGQFVMSEERDRQLVLFTYAAGTTLSRSGAQTVKLGTFVDNTGIEGLSYDPQTGGYICVKEISPQGIFQTGVDFPAGTATNGSPTTVNSIDLFDPALAALADFADVFALSNLPTVNGAESGRLLVLSQASARIVNVDRSGNISSSLQIVADSGSPLSAADQQHEGLTMDRDGILYVVNENGGGDIDHPQLWVYAPSTVSNQAPTAVALDNAITAIVENTPTIAPIKVADIAVTDDGLGTNNLTVTGTDAGFFEITGSGLYIKAGTVLDYETRTSYSVTVNVDDTTVGVTPDATADYTLAVTDVVDETPVIPSVFISEVHPSGSGNTSYSADWFEVTNNGTTAVTITGWQMDDNSNGTAKVALRGVTSIPAGQSAIFFEGLADGSTDAAKIASFSTAWFGSATPPAGFLIGAYGGAGVGLSTGGDAVNLFDAGGNRITGVSFGTTTTGVTFDNHAGLGSTALPLPTISTLSVVGVNSAFLSTTAVPETGSPGTTGKLIISEVAPWSSTAANSPVAADWFEVTNLGATAVDITGWKMDDNSESPAAAVALNGITSIAAGESVIFIETNDLSGKTATFLPTWFGTNPPVDLQIGSYTGSGIGLSTTSDAVNLYDSNNVRQAKVFFGASPAGPKFPTFDNAAGLTNAAISQLSVVGVNSAIVAVNDVKEIGSPGTISNYTPVAGNDSETTAEDVAVTFNVLTNDSDANLDTLTIASFTVTSDGVLVSNGSGSFTYTPALNFNGSDSFTYTITDGRGGTATATVSIGVTLVNDQPTADAISVTTDEDTAKAIMLSGSDVETLAANLVFTITQAPAHGSLSGSGANLTYIPAANYNGPDSFQYTVTDSGDGSDPALTSDVATVSIDVTPVNDKPTADAKSVATSENVPVGITLSGSDVETPAASLVFAITTQPLHGTLAVNGTQVVYTPAIGYSGADSFSYTVTDNGDGASAELTSDEVIVSINVASANGQPVVFVGNDPLHPGQSALFVFGTNHKDHIKIESECHDRIAVEIKSAGIRFEQIYIGPFSRIVLYGQAGDDHIEVDDDTFTEAWLFGGADDDHLHGGGGSNILLGGEGDDYLTAGRGSDVLIGGVGSDHLQARRGEDILIGGTTDYDANAVALAAILGEWNSVGDNYLTRIAALQSSSSAYRLNASTVHDDGVRDHLQGDSDLDWFFAHLSGNKKERDQISGLTNGEVVTVI